jgi:enoyl-CoA hydratase/carnithine racemase
MNDARTGGDAEATLRAERSGRVHVVVIDRRGRRNAFDDALIERFCELVGALADSSPRAAVLASAGSESFSAGYDIRCIDPAARSGWGWSTRSSRRRECGEERSSWPRQ